MSYFYGIPSLQAVTTIGGTTTNVVDLQGGLYSSSYTNLGGGLDVTAPGTWVADQNFLTNYYVNFGDAQEVRVGFDGSSFLIDPVTSGSGAKVYFGDGSTAAKITCADIDCQVIDGTQIGGQSGIFIQTATGATVLELRSAATNDDPSVKWRQGRVATTDATVTTIDTIATTSDTCIMVNAMVVARRTGGTAGTAGDIAAYGRRAAFKNVAGVLTQIGTTLAVGTFESQAGWDCTVVVSGTDILVRATGAVNNNVTWHSTTQVLAVGS
jgi:hypothetical protein